VLHEGGEEQRVHPAHEQNLAPQAEARVGTEKRYVRGVAPQLPAEHVVVGPSGTELQTECKPA
jgi:hypothetical protein